MNVGRKSSVSEKLVRVLQTLGFRPSIYPQDDPTRTTVIRRKSPEGSSYVPLVTCKNPRVVSTWINLPSHLEIAWPSFANLVIKSVAFALMLKEGHKKEWWELYHITKTQFVWKPKMYQGKKELGVQWTRYSLEVSSLHKKLMLHEPIAFKCTIERWPGHLLAAQKLHACIVCTSVRCSLRLLDLPLLIELGYAVAVRQTSKGG